MLLLHPMWVHPMWVRIGALGGGSSRHSDDFEGAIEGARHEVAFPPPDPHGRLSPPAQRGYTFGMETIQHLRQSTRHRAYTVREIERMDENRRDRLDAHTHMTYHCTKTMTHSSYSDCVKNDPTTIN